MIEGLGSSPDVGELYELQRHQQILLGELQHRERNTLGGDPPLELVWSESGVDLPAGDPERCGVGLELLLRALPYELSAETEIEFNRTGLRFSLKMPLDRALASGGFSAAA